MKEIDLNGDVALRKLVAVFGEEGARALVAEIREEVGLAELSTPDDRLRFGAALMKRGGLLEAIGRAIKIQALLHGATDPDARAPNARGTSGTRMKSA